MREYLQIQLITGAEDTLFQRILNELIKINDNQYILTADIQGIKRFESMLGITSSETETLEVRRNRILSKWNDELPYTMKSLRKQLDIICGENNYNIDTDFNNYQMQITTHLSKYGEVDAFQRILDCMLPCNILLATLNVLYQNVDIIQFVGGAISVIKKESIAT